MERAVFFDDATAYRARVSDFLIEREAEHNLLFGLSDTLIREPTRYEEHVLVSVERDAQVVAAALMTPPHNLVVSLGDDDAMRALVRGLRDAPIDVPGVTGPAPQSRAFAGAWCALSGSTATVNFNQRIYRLTEVRAPSGVPGAVRPASPEDRALLRGWLGGFNVEALGEAREPDALDKTLDWYFGGEGRGLHVWVDGGEPVSVAGHTGPTPNGIRIGPVYTPPDRRGRGYASACTAAVSAEQLARGRRFCFLFTDLANPTSNAIYQRIGYEPVCDVDQYRFVA